MAAWLLTTLFSLRKPTAPLSYLIVVFAWPHSQSFVWLNQLSSKKKSFFKMTPTELDECFEFVHKLVVRCGDVLKEGFKNTGEVTTKGAAHELVTFWDNEIEKILITGIKEKYPEHK